MIFNLHFVSVVLLNSTYTIFLEYLITPINFSWLCPPFLPDSFRTFSNLSDRIPGVPTFKSADDQRVKEIERESKYYE